MKNLKIAIKELPRNLLFQIILIIFCMIPLIETIGQYINSGYMIRKSYVLILFWPGVKSNLCIPMRIWMAIGIISLSYIFGLLYLIKKRTLGEVFTIGAAFAIIIANGLGFCVNHLTGWTELQQQFAAHSSGFIVNPDSANMDIFSLWHNPAWEEIVFRGIPLIILMLLKNKLSAKAYKYGEIIYILIPSIIFAIYHMPSHGPSRIVDTFIFGCVCAYLALKYSFFAPLILHYMADAHGILNSIVKSKSIPKNQVIWLSQNYNLLNIIYTICFACLLISVPIIIVWKIKNLKKTQNACNSFS